MNDLSDTTILAAEDDSLIIEKQLNRYRDVIDSIHDYVCRLNLSLEITFINKTYASHLGLKPSAAIGRRYIDLIQESISKAVFNQLSSVFSGVACSTEEFKLTDARGDVAWQQWHF